jgi:nucleoside-diphosphate-sugar epimerase
MADKLVIGCGYLGRVVAARWRDAGHRVVATTRTPNRATELRALGHEPVICDVMQPASLLLALPRSVDTVFHCVGFDRTTAVPMRTVYVEGLANVLTALCTWRGRFIYVSSTSVYGQTAGEEVDEDAATQPAEDSGRVVLEAEQLLRERRPDAIILRFAGIYGPGRLPRAREIVAGEALAADPETWLNLIHVEDGAAAVLAADERGRPGAVYNIADDRPVPRREFYAHLAAVLRAPHARFLAPPDAHDVNRRVANRRMKQELGVVLRYPSPVDGLHASACD